MAQSIWDKSENDLEKDVGSMAGHAGAIVQNQVKNQFDNTTRAIVAQLFGIDTSKKDNKTNQTSQQSTQPQNASSQTQQTPQSLEQLAGQPQQGSQQQTLDQTNQTTQSSQQMQHQVPTQSVNLQGQMSTLAEPGSLFGSTSADPMKQGEEEKKKKEHEKMHEQQYYHATFGNISDIQGEMNKDSELEKKKKEQQQKAEEEEKERQKRLAEEKRKKELPLAIGKNSKAALKATKPGRNRMELDMAKKKTEVYRGTVG